MDREKNEFDSRISVMSFLFSLVCFIIVFKLINIQIVKHEENTRALDSKLTTTKHYLTTRGKILSRDGVVLAYDAPSYQLQLKVEDLSFNSGLVHELAYCLSTRSKRFKELREEGTLAPSVDAMLKKVKGSTERLKREPLLMDIAHLNDIPIQKLVKAVQTSFENCLKKWAYMRSWQTLDIYIDEKGARQLIEQPERYSGFACRMDAVRSYPQKELASHIVGYVGNLNEKNFNILRILGHYPQSPDSIKPIVLTELEKKNLAWVRNYDVGISGVEKIFNNALRGRLHKKTIIRGQGEVTVPDEQITEGKSIALSIDYTLQSIAKEALDGRQGSIVMIDLDSGDILVSVSGPSFDPNVISPPTNTNFGQYLQSRPGVLLNRSLANHYPFGSVFKIVTAVAAIEENIITPEKTYFCSLKHQKTGKKCLGYHSDISVINALKRSCNIFFYECALEMGPVKLYNWSRKFHLGQSLNTGFGYEKDGLIPNRAYKRRVTGEMWYPGDTCSMAIGQGDHLGTPLQAAVLAGLISREEGMIRPQFWKHRNRDTIKLEISPYTRDIVRRGLWKVVNENHGTAYESKSETIEYAGKSGTADVYNKEPHAWFAGFAPYDKPKVAIACVVEHSGHGGDISAPVVKIVLEAWQQKYQSAQN